MIIKKFFIVTFLILSFNVNASKTPPCIKIPESISNQEFWDYFRKEITKKDIQIECLPISDVLVKKGELDGDPILKFKGRDRYNAVSQILNEDSGLGEIDIKTGKTKKLSQKKLIINKKIITDRDKDNQNYMRIGSMVFEYYDNNWKLVKIYGNTI